jgi:hypothetical protein
MCKKISFILLIIFIISPCTLLFGIEHIAITMKVKGDVDLTRNNNIYSLNIQDRLFNDDLIESKENSFAALFFADDNSIVKLFPNSILLINAQKDNKKLNKKCKLSMGEMWAKVGKIHGDFEVETPTTVVSVKGTEFLLSYDEDGFTDVFTFSGEVTLMNKADGSAATIGAGEHGHTIGTGFIEVTDIEPGDINRETQDFIDIEIKPIEIKEEPQPEIEKEETPQTYVPPVEQEVRGTRVSAGSEGFSMGGGVGTIMIGDMTYSQIRLMPELVFGKFGIGLNIELLIDSEGQIREEDWDDWEDYINKIYYVRYGHRGDKFFGRIGGFPNYTLAHGLIMRDYSNMLRYPDDRQIGLQLGGRLPYASMNIEGFSSNILENEILAGRLTFQPLLTSSVPLLKKIILGGTIAHDRNQYKGLLDSDDDNYPDVFDDYPFDNDWHNEVDYEIDVYQEIYFELYPNATEDDFLDWFYNSPTLNALRNSSFKDLGEEDITIAGLDYELPIYDSELFYLSHYGEAVQIFEHKNGFIFPGFYSKFLIFHMNLEYRFYQEDFLPAFFDHLYEEERAKAYIYEEGDSTISIVITKEDLLAEATQSQGWYASLTTNLFNTIFLTVSYEDMYGEDNIHNRSIWGKVNLEQRIIPNLNRAEISYSQTRFEKLKYFKTPTSLVKGILGYSIGRTTELIASYQERYVDLDGNGKIKGEGETITTMSFGVEFRF